jgi:hypothetical protein
MPTGLAVALDVVYNHFGPEGCYLRDYGPYFTDRYSGIDGIESICSSFCIVRSSRPTTTPANEPCARR